MILYQDLDSISNIYLLKNGILYKFRLFTYLNPLLTKEGDKKYFYVKERFIKNITSSSFEIERGYGSREMIFDDRFNFIQGKCLLGKDHTGEMDSLTQSNIILQ